MSTEEDDIMKVTREQAAENHDRIVETAARLFREHGFEGVGVAELMKAAGLTHGGFYGHFESKEDLVQRACERVLERSTERWRDRVEGARGCRAPRSRRAPRDHALARFGVRLPHRPRARPHARRSPREGGRDAFQLGR